MTHEKAIEMLSNEPYENRWMTIYNKALKCFNILLLEGAGVVDTLTYNHYSSQENKYVINKSTFLLF
jgi:hypothetical protein